MGILDLFRRRKKGSVGQAAAQIRPASLPGQVTAYDAQADRGTIELENGQRLSFTSAAFGGAHPAQHQGVLVTGIAGTAAATVQTLEHGAMPLALDEEPYEAPLPQPAARTRGGSRAPSAPPPPDPANPVLEQALLQDPDDVESHLVLGDWLQDQGHPRGELIALMARLEQQPDHDVDALEQQIGALFSKQRQALLGALFSDVDYQLRVEDGRVTLADPGEGRSLELGWRLGFIASARVAEPWDSNAAMNSIELLRCLLQLPSARQLRELALGVMNPDGDPADCYHGAVELLQAAGPRPTLRKLFIGDFVYPDEMEVSWTGTGPLGTIWPLLPNLREVILQAGEIDLGRLDLPRLRSFEVRTGGLSKANIRAICAANWPELSRLVVWFGDEAYGAEGSIEDVEPLLAGDRLHGVRELGLMNCDFTDAICQALVRSPLARQLTALDLSLGTMSDEGARALAEGAAALPALEQLDVSQNYLTDEGLGALQRCGWALNTAEQDVPDEGYRYVSVGE